MPEDHPGHILPAECRSGLPARTPSARQWYTAPAPHSAWHQRKPLPWRTPAQQWACGKWQKMPPTYRRASAPVYPVLPAGTVCQSRCPRCRPAAMQRPLCRRCRRKSASPRWKRKSAVPSVQAIPSPHAETPAPCWFPCHSGHG